MKLYLWGFALLNLIDLVSTFWALDIGFATELNPVMRWSYEAGPWYFVLAKAGLTAAAMTILWMTKEVRLSLVMAQGFLLVYAALVGWHAAMWSLYLRG